MIITAIEPDERQDRRSLPLLFSSPGTMIGPQGWCPHRSRSHRHGHCWHGGILHRGWSPSRIPEQDWQPGKSVTLLHWRSPFVKLSVDGHHINRCLTPV